MEVGNRHRVKCQHTNADVSNSNNGFSEHARGVSEMIPSSSYHRVPFLYQENDVQYIEKREGEASERVF